MISRPAFTNKVRALGYKRRPEKKRVRPYRHPQTLHTIPIPKKARLSEPFVRSALRQAGLEREEIENFIGEATA